MVIVDSGVIVVYDRYQGGVILRRTSITIPPEIDKLVEEYRKKNGINSWTAALYELARKGNEASK
jgi:hypothetical protein